MKINWKKGPGYQKIAHFTFPEYESLTLDNGIPLSLVNAGSQDIIRFDIVFRGARFLESKKMASRMTSGLMREGTRNYNSETIAETIDYYGSVLRTNANLDYSFLSLSGLSKHFSKLLPVVQDILYYPVFPEDEIEKYKKTNIQKLQHDLSKNELVNYRIFTENMFGKDHPYGYNTEEQYIRDIEKADLESFHKHAFGNNHCFMLLGGRYTDDMVRDVNSFLGQRQSVSPEIAIPESSYTSARNRIVVPSKNVHQSSIKIGRRLFNRHHPDFAGFYVLNTILGGYFGSRLMASIREEKGLTYNIYSVIDNLIFDGYFYIETEVALGSEEQTLQEIYDQLTLLREQKCGEDELQMVKNYLLGNFLNLIDGPLNILSFLRSLQLDYADRPHFEKFINTILSITPEDIQLLAQKYFNQEDMTEVIVGGTSFN